MTHSFIHAQPTSHRYVIVVSDFFRALRSDEASCAKAGWIGAALTFTLLRSFRFEFPELCRTSTGVLRQVLAASFTVVRMDKPIEILYLSFRASQVYNI